MDVIFFEFQVGTDPGNTINNGGYWLQVLARSIRKSTNLGMNDIQPILAYLSIKCWELTWAHPLTLHHDIHCKRSTRFSASHHSLSHYPFEPSTTWSGHYHHRFSGEQFFDDWGQEGSTIGDLDGMLIWEFDTPIGPNNHKIGCKGIKMFDKLITCRSK